MNVHMVDNSTNYEKIMSLIDEIKSLASEGNLTQEEKEVLNYFLSHILEMENQ